MHIQCGFDSANFVKTKQHTFKDFRELMRLAKQPYRGEGKIFIWPSRKHDLFITTEYNPMTGEHYNNKLHSTTRENFAGHMALHGSSELVMLAFTWIKENGLYKGYDFGRSPYIAFSWGGEDDEDGDDEDDLGDLDNG